MKTDLLKNKTILVTAGSTWIPIDTVRVMTNIFRGAIGFTIANLAADLGADVTLLLGPSFDLSGFTPSSNLKIIRFKFFDDLDSLMSDLLTKNKFDAVIHSAAVSDFKASRVVDGKIKSNVDKLIIELVPTKKLVDSVKSLSPGSFLVKFKLEVGLSEKQLYDVAFKSLGQSNADLIVANIYNPEFKTHEAYIIDKKGISMKVIGKENIAKQILAEIYERT